MLLLDPDQFGGADAFRSEVHQLVDYVRSCPRIEGVERILLPGDPERVTLQQRTTTGVYLDEENWAQLVQLAQRLHAAAPPTASP